MSTTTNGHVNGYDGQMDLATSVRWMRPTDLPSYLGGALVPAKVPDEAPIWGEQMPDPEALEAAVTRAETVVELQDTEVLARAKSPGDLAADLAAARELRDLERDHSQERRKAKLDEAREVAEHERRLRRLRRQADERTAVAEVRAERASDPRGDLVRLDRARKWVPLLASVPAWFAIVAGAINVGSELSRIFPHTPVISWVVDPIITLAIVAIMFAHLFSAVPSMATGLRERNPYFVVEAFLFVLTGAAAVGLHYVPGPTPQAAATPDGALVWMVVPIGLGVSLWLVPKLRTDLTAKFVQAQERVRQAKREVREEGCGEGLTTPSDLHGNNPGNTSPRAARTTGSGRVTATIPEPKRKTRDEHAATLRGLVQRGEIDPATTSVNATRKALRCRPEIAADLLRTEYGRTDLTTKAGDQ